MQIKFRFMHCILCILIVDTINIFGYIMDIFNAVKLCRMEHIKTWKKKKLLTLDNASSQALPPVYSAMVYKYK